MPGILAFVDTNVLLYAASTDPAEAGKRAEARRILSGGAFAFSVQVAQEFFVNATRKPTPALSSSDALAFLKGINPTTVVALDYELFEEATGIQQRFQISYWDAAIVAAAKRLNCRALYSEDLSDGQSYDGVRVVNPFRSAAKT
jgi:predicted nucleic acid-binding protein